MSLTTEQIRSRGLKALRDELGQAGMIRFLRQSETGSGDYAVSRRHWVDRSNLTQIRKLASKTTRKRA